MAVAAKAEPTIFPLKQQLLSSGRSRTPLAKSDLMTATLMVYAEGGENAMHAHMEEDHLFVIMNGEATFHLDSDDNIHVVKKHECVMMPKGCFYWFNASGDENLVMLRVGARVAGQADDDRIDPSGGSMRGNSAENKHTPGVPVPGKFFE